MVGGNGQVGVALGVAGADLGALGVAGSGNLAAGLGLLGGARVVNDGLVVLVAAVREVHAHDVEAGGAELVDGLGRVGLGADGADDGRAAVVLLGLEGRVELGQPVDPADLL